MLIAVETACPPIVPSAAPRTPMSKPKTSSASSAIWTRMGTTQVMVAKRIRPSARIRLEKPVPTSVPARMTTA